MPILVVVALFMIMEIGRWRAWGFFFALYFGLLTSWPLTACCLCRIFVNRRLRALPALCTDCGEVCPKVADVHTALNLRKAAASIFEWIRKPSGKLRGGSVYSRARGLAVFSSSHHPNCAFKRESLGATPGTAPDSETKDYALSLENLPVSSVTVGAAGAAAAPLSGVSRLRIVRINLHRWRWRSLMKGHFARFSDNCWQVILHYNLRTYLHAPDTTDASIQCRYCLVWKSHHSACLLVPLFCIHRSFSGCSSSCIPQ